MIYVYVNIYDCSKFDMDNMCLKLLCNRYCNETLDYFMFSLSLFHSSAISFCQFPILQQLALLCVNMTALYRTLTSLSDSCPFEAYRPSWLISRLLCGTEQFSFGTITLWQTGFDGSCNGQTMEATLKLAVNNEMS